MPFSLSKLARTRDQVRSLAPILGVLARYGFGHFIRRLGLRHLIPLRYSGVETGDEISAPKRFRMALEELGPTFVKFGQMLSTRADLLPENYLAELRTLTEHVPPFDTAIARKIVERELKRPLGEILAEFAETPVASGSIGQVYHATLPDGSPVVVKVKRPGIEKALLANIDLLEVLARLADRIIDELKPLRLPMVVDEFRESVLREVDFVTEGAFTAKIKSYLAHDERVRVPTVYWDLTTSEVLTLERIAGTSLNRKAELAAMNVDRKRLARDLTEIFLNQFFKAGLFHADPHAGNILITPDGHIGLVDFGMAARLSRELRSHLATSFIALTRQDLETIADVYVEIGVISASTDIDHLKRDLQAAIDKYYGIPTRCLDLNRCFNDALRIARTHKIVLPRDFVLLGKSFVTMAIMAREIDPDIDLAQIAKPYALSLAVDKLSPKRIGQSLLHESWYLIESLRRLPRDMRSLTRKLLTGNMQITLHVREFERAIRELDRATNRLAFSILVGAIVIGSSVVLHARIQPSMQDLFGPSMPSTSALGLFGFLLAGILGMLLAIAIWRSGRI